MKQIDERDIMFSRMILQKGSKEYKEYYQKYPERKKFDDNLRSKPEVFSNPKAEKYNKLKSPLINAGFQYLADIKHLAEGECVSEKVKTSPKEITDQLKIFSKFLGADLFGIAKLNANHYYSHRGREGNYGEKINNKHKYAIVFLTEMEEKMIAQAPNIEMTMASVKGYVKAGTTGMWLAYYLRNLGYEARNHLDGNYLLVAPLVARDAGLGGIGRNALLLTRKFGPRVRIGIVTTNLELIPDKKRDFGFLKLCNSCKRCAKKCAAESISFNNFSEGKKISIDQKKCYEMWSKLGTDCGICIDACPLSHNIPAFLLNKLQQGNRKVIKEILKASPEKNYDMD
jgi:epoxyqueuosine reductase QueG